MSVIQYNLLEHDKIKGNRRHQGLHKAEKDQESKGENNYNKERRNNESQSYWFL